MKSLLMLINEDYPFGNAYASRARALASIFCDIGFSVTILCRKNTVDKEAICGDTRCEIISFASGKTVFGKIIEPLQYAKFVKKLYLQRQFDFVFVRSMYDRFAPLINTLNRLDACVILESCERYNVKTFKRKYLNPRYWQFLHCWYCKYPKVDGVIAISRYLQNYYQNKGLPTIRVPAILCAENMRFSTEVDPTVIKLVYTGHIDGGKEVFGEFFKALSKQSFEKKFVISFIGPSKEDVLSSLNRDELNAYQKIKEQIRFLGHIPQSKVNEELVKNDFGIILRPNRLSSQAGFPTKLGEYLSSGLGVIANDTGDISLHLQNGYNGFLLEKCEESSISRVLKDIESMSCKELQKMRENARKSALETLDYSIFEDKMQLFFEKINSERG